MDDGRHRPVRPVQRNFYNRNEDATRFEGEDPAKEDACVEIWNLVFMQFNRDNQGVLHSLPKPCVDTGMGLERLCAVLQNKTSNFDTDLFVALISEAKAAIEAAGGKAEQDSVSLRVIADHIRAAAYLVADQVLPSTKGADMCCGALSEERCATAINSGLATRFCRPCQAAGQIDGSRSSGIAGEA